MANSKNLRPAPPWKPGQSGNPKGKPPGAKSLTTILRELMEKSMTMPKDPITKKEGVKKQIKEIIVLRLASEAMKGNLTAAREIFDRLEGKSTETSKVDLNHSGGLVIEKRLFDD